MMKKCKTCYGYGFWSWGDKVPMGSLDAHDGIPTLPCSECKHSYNDKDIKVSKWTRAQLI